MCRGMPKKGMPRVVGGWGKCWRCLSEQVNTSREDIILLGHYQSQLAMATSTPPNFIQKLTEGKIDFVGQQLVETFIKLILVIATIVSFLAGLAAQSLSLTFGIFGASTFVLALIVVPPWPMYNRYPPQWLPAVEDKAKKEN